MRFFLSGFEKIYKGIEISTTSSSDFSNLSQSFCFGFLPTAAYGPPLGFPHLYGVFRKTSFGRARKRAKSANVVVFFGEQFIFDMVLKIIEKNHINLVHVRSRAPAWILRYISNNKFKTVSTFHNVYGNQNFIKRYYNKGMCSVDKIVAISEYVKSSIVDIYKINEGFTRL